MRFSERYGYKPVRNTIQFKSMDESLRNGLWSLLKIHCWNNIKENRELYSVKYFLDDPANREFKNLCEKLWFDYFKTPLDEIENEWIFVLEELKKYFFSCDWNEVYDFIEFIGNNYKKNNFKINFWNDCNKLLEIEMSAYRFIDGLITPITNDQEIATIEQTINESFNPVSAHLHRSLELLSDRKSPDCRNSIKESISAVESLVKIKLGVDKGTLGQLLDKLNNEFYLHSALETAFKKLYGYTSDEDGIRHAMIEQANVDFHDAKFMLVACSAFINYVEGKTQNKG